MVTELNPVSSGEWQLFAAMMIILFGCIAIAELMRKFTDLSAGTTRKIVHILVGIFVFFVPILFISPVPAILMSLLFIALNYVSVRFALFKGMDDPVHQTYGTVYFPLAFLILVVLFWYQYPIIISTSILILGLGDAAASVVGQRVRNPRELKIGRDRKTMQGSLTMVLVTAAVTTGCLLFYPDDVTYSSMILGSKIVFILIVAIITAVVSGVAEALSFRGTDNLFIPAVSALILFVFLEGGDSMAVQLPVGFIFALVVSILSLRAGFLSSEGAAATFLMAVIIFGIGGWIWTIPILIFFILSSLISKIKNPRKQHAESRFAKSHRRDAGQVFANGGIATLFVIADFIHAHPLWYAAYLGAVAAAMADTWGTEVGVSFSEKAWSILTWEKVPAGFSGGVSAPGITAGIVGAALIGFSGILSSDTTAAIHPRVTIFILIIVAAGFFGSLMDSYAGALLQVQYKCPRCGLTIEAVSHCGIPTSPYRGIRWIDNDYVNVVCTASGAAASVLLFIIL
jgi:uncharacterized protein (TIGR00297 family)